MNVISHLSFIPVLLFTLLLASCGSSSNSTSDGGATTDGATTEGTTTEANTTEGSTAESTTTDGVTTEGTSTDGATTGGSQSGLLSDIPEFLLADCGALPVESAVVSASGATPTTIAVNTIVSATIDPDTTSNAEHFWNIPVNAGYYHLIADSIRVDKTDSNIGLFISDRDKDNSANGNLIRGNDIDRRLREHYFFEIPAATTLRLRVLPGHDAEDYQLGLFENGSSIPSPYLTECPAINALSVGTNQRVELIGLTEPAGDQWFSIDANVAEHSVSVFATRVDNTSSNIIFIVTAFDRFAQRSREEELLRTNEIGLSSDNSGSWIVNEVTNRWIRIRNLEREGDAYSLDVLISEN